MPSSGGSRGGTLRVAAVMDTFDMSGPAKQLLALVPALRERGVWLTVITVDPPSGAISPFVGRLKQLGVSHHRISAGRGCPWRYAARLRRVLHEIEPDVVQTHSYRPTVLVGSLLWRSRDWKWVVFHHGVTRENGRMQVYLKLEQWAAHSADHVVVVAESQAPQFASRARQVTVIPNAVVDVVVPSLMRWPPPEDQVPAARFLCVGRLSPEKGVDILLEALSRLIRSGMPAALRIVGTGPAERELRRTARNLGIASAVQFVGHAEEVSEFYNCAHCVVLPSYSEGSPNVVLEAIAYGRYVVATNVGGVPDMLGHDGLGCVVQPGSADLLAEAMRQALLGRFAVDAAARDAALLRFSISGRADTHAALYASLFASGYGSENRASSGWLRIDQNFTVPMKRY
jgi:glycosyltransferase involved in cell wall biosynthesis